jgi:hypothetical protein
MTLDEAVVTLTVKHPKCRVAKVMSRLSPGAAVWMVMHYHMKVCINGKVFWRGTIGEMMERDQVVAAVLTPRG